MRCDSIPKGAVGVSAKVCRVPVMSNGPLASAGRPSSGSTPTLAGAPLERRVANLFGQHVPLLGRQHFLRALHRREVVVASFLKLRLQAREHRSELTASRAFRELVLYRFDHYFVLRGERIRDRLE